jgi:bacteriocin biosynthesis cyclodehydratase domain-containing protein
LFVLLHLLLRCKPVTAVPEKPLLAPWYRLVEVDDRLLLEHGQSVVVLEGAAVKAFLPALLPLLDGTRARNELVGRLGVVAGPAVDLALETLASHGLLVEGPDVSSGMTATAHALAAMFDLAPRVVAERLSEAAVAVVGASRAGSEVVRLLRASGAGSVSTAGWRSETPVDLTIVCPGPNERGELDDWNRRANERGMRWLLVGLYDGRFAGVGPLVVPGESCCHECFVRRRNSNSEYGEHFRALDATPVAAQADPAFEAFVAALTAHSTLRWIGGRDTNLPGVFFAVEARPAMSLTMHPVLRVPRCPVCSHCEQIAGRLPWHEAKDDVRAAA